MNWMIAVTIINWLIIYFMPKRISPQMIYVTWGILVTITFVCDLYLGITLDLFDYGINANITGIDIILETLMPSSFGIIFLNFMPIERKRFILYTFTWVIFSLFFEWFSVQVSWMTYKGWKLWYSLPFYIGTFLFIHWHWWFLNKNKDHSDSGV